LHLVGELFELYDDVQIYKLKKRDAIFQYVTLVQSVHFIVSAAHRSCVAREASIRQEFTVLRHPYVNGNELKCKVNPCEIYVQGHDKIGSLIIIIIIYLSWNWATC